MTKIRAGIIGGAGYTGGELLRLLLQHPQTELSFVHSRSHAGRPVYEVFPDLLGDTDIQFTDTVQADTDVVFFCLGHGESKNAVLKYNFPQSVRIIDLSQDFRLKAEGNSFVYGLPELNRAQIQKASHIANPGCFATAVQLALLPLASNALINFDIHITACTGSTGAGRAPGETSHFSWRQNNLSVYKAFEHQHLSEIRQSLKQTQSSFDSEILFIPQRGTFTRGIFATLSLRCDKDINEIKDLFEDYYSSHPFTHISSSNIDLKQVVNTNKCMLYLEKHGSQLMIVSIIDNLLKGASGQAVQNMNLMFGLDEQAGLKLKASAY